MDTSAYAELFLSEAREYLSSINQALLSYEKDPEHTATLDELFRGVHTLKGMAASMGYSLAADLAHEFEHKLDLLRGGELMADQALLGLLFDAADALELSVEASAAGSRPPASVRDALERLRTAPDASAAGGLATKQGQQRDAAVPDPSGEDSLVHPADTHKTAGAETKEAAETPPVPDGEREKAKPESSREDSSRPELERTATKYRVRLRVEPSGGLPAARAFLALRQARTLGRVSDEEAIETGLKRGSIGSSVEFQLESAEEPHAIAEILRAVGELEDVDVTPLEPDAIAGEEPAAKPSGGATPYIRVRRERLDNLLNQMGELVIARDRLRELVSGFDSPELEEAADQATRLIGDMRDEVMRARMVPVWQVFDRFPRVVRDAARALGRKVDFQLEGRDIELDRALLEELCDPIVHLLRNAVAHGIEPPDERRAAGKPEVSRLRLAVSRERSGARVEVADDGRGIQRERVLETAVRRGLRQEGEAAALPDEQLLGLLTHPGFSTSANVTEVAGRGVGLDVVAYSLRSLGGTMQVSTEAGAGTTFTLKLPLSLALLRALIVRVGGATYALPLTAVVETAEAYAPDVRQVGGGRLLRLRERSMPLLPLHTLLTGGEAEPRDPVSVVIVEQAAARVALEVDELCGQQELVLKDFDTPREAMPVFAGATILADGRPTLVVDVPSLLAYANAHTEGARSGELVS